MGLQSAERYADGPWGLPAPTGVAELVKGAGFVDVSVEQIRRPVRFEAGAGQLDHGLAASGLAPEIAGLASGERKALAEALADNLRGLTDASGAVASYLTSHIVLAGVR
jgi:hypothetical protein